jgi:hypothetical protein
MGLLDRLRHNGAATAPTRPPLAQDARAMRVALDAMQAEGGAGAEVDLRPMVRDLLTGEVAAPTRDVATLRDERLEPDDFYDKELLKSWDGLDEDTRAARLEGFLDLAAMVEEAGDVSGIPEDMAARTRTKALLLAWAFDRTYGYLGQIEREGA